MDELPLEWTELGRADAEALAPPDGAKDRVRERVALTLGLGAGFIVATAASSTVVGGAAGSAAAGGSSAAGSAAAVGSAAAGGGVGGTATATGIAGSLLLKKALVVGVAAAVGVGGGTAAYLEVRSEQARKRQQVAAVKVQEPRPIAHPAAPPAPAPEPLAVQPPEAPDTLGQERALLDEARGDIVQGRLRDARVLLSRHAQEFRDGHLAEEREALLIRLLVREGHESEARARAARFRRAHPRSIQLPGIDEALRSRR